MANDSSKHQPPPAQLETKASKQLEPLASTDLLQGQRERQIVHGNEVIASRLHALANFILHKITWPVFVSDVNHSLRVTLLFLPGKKRLKCGFQCFSPNGISFLFWMK